MTGHPLSTKLIAIDLDGTFLTSARVPHPENIAAVQRAQEAGVQIVFASGRIRPSMLPFIAPLGLERPVVCSNGGHVIGPDGEELAHFGITREIFEIVLEYVRANGVHLNVYTREEMYFLSDSPWGEEYVHRTRTVRPKVTDSAHAASLDVLKVILIDEPEAIKHHAQALRKQLPEDAARLTESEPEYLEVLHPQADKFTGLQLLTEHLGIEQLHTGAIGDFWNDLEMIRWAGVGGAIGNAIPEVREAADFVARRNDEAGVAQFIDWVLANRRE